MTDTASTLYRNCVENIRAEGSEYLSSYFSLVAITCSVSCSGFSSALTAYSSARFLAYRTLKASIAATLSSFVILFSLFLRLAYSCLYRSKLPELHAEGD